MACSVGFGVALQGLFSSSTDAADAFGDYKVSSITLFTAATGSFDYGPFGEGPTGVLGVWILTIYVIFTAIVSFFAF